MKHGMPMDDMDVDDEALKSIIDKAHSSRGQALLTVILGGGGEEPDEDASGGMSDADEDDLMP